MGAEIGERLRTGRGAGHGTGIRQPAGLRAMLWPVVGIPLPIPHRDRRAEVLVVCGPCSLQGRTSRECEWLLVH